MGLPSSLLPSHLQMNNRGLERRPLTGLKRQYPIRYRCSQRRKRAQLRADYVFHHLRNQSDQVISPFGGPRVSGSTPLRDHGNQGSYQFGKLTG